MPRQAPPFARRTVVACLLSAFSLSAAYGDFVPPFDHEGIPPGEAEAIQTIVGMIEAGANALAERGGRPILRDAHAKGHGCVAATFTFTTDAAVAPDLKKGVFAEVRSYPAWIRFSNGSPMPEEDRIGDVRGMAIKLVGVPGPKLLSDESAAVTQDFVLVDFPRFFLRDALEYVPFTKLALEGMRDAHFESKPDQKAILHEMESRSVDHLFAQRYFSMTPSLLGKRPVKLGAWPVACVGSAGSGARPAESDPNDLRAGMRTWLEARDACFRFTVQPQADATMPVRTRPCSGTKPARRRSRSR